MTIEEKLNSIRQTKQAIKTSIRNKGVELEDTAPFNTYPSKIDEIETQAIIETENIEITPTKETQTINRSENKYIESVKVNAIPNEYIVPSGELEITENGQYDVTDKASVNVEIASSDGGDLSEYFNSNATDLKNSSSYPFMLTNYFKKMPDIVIPDNITKLSFLFGGSGTANGYQLNIAPKIIFNNNIVSLENAFRNIQSNVNLDLSSCNTENVTNMQSCFNYCTGLTSLDLSKFNTSNVTNMAYMFQDCSKLTSLDLSNFNTSNVTNIVGMFKHCNKLTSLDIRNFDTSNVTSMIDMFVNCKVLDNLDLSNFDTDNVTNMSNMFYSCEKLTSLNLSSFNTNNVKGMSSMFYGCKLLIYLDIRNFDFTNVTSYSSMFGSSASNGVPDDCLIIVKDETAKTWITEKFTRLTNVKTVAEYEAQ